MISRKNVLAALAIAGLFPVQAFAASPTLSVTQAATANGSVPKGAQRVPFLSLTLAAGCDADATVRELTLAHEGLGDSSDLDRVYVMDGRRRLTRARAVDSSDRTVTLRFAPQLTVEACESRALTVYADVSPEAESSGEHRLRVESASDVAGDARVALSRAEASSTSVVRPKSVGTVSATVEGPNVPVRFGKSRTLARIRLEADGERDQDIRTITLTNRGKATDGDLKNLRIQNRKGKVLTDTQATMDGDRVTLTFDPALRLDRNDEILLELKGDVAASKRRTIRFVLEEPSDLEAAPRAR